MLVAYLKVVWHSQSAAISTCNLLSETKDVEFIESVADLVSVIATIFNSVVLESTLHINFDA